MNKDWRYILYLSIVVGVFVAIKMLSPKQYDWHVTLAHDDKNPFGTYALQALLKADSVPVISSYKTLYELKDSITNRDVIFILTSRFDTGKEDINVLLDKVSQGNTAFIAANNFYGTLADSLGLSTFDNLFEGKELFAREDTATLHLTNTKWDSLTTFPYRRDNIHNFFGSLDSVQSTVLARNEIHQPVAVHIPVGKGRLILSSTPMVFTNIHVLSKQNQEFAAGLLSFLPSGHRIYRTEYYHVGRLESSTPLRFILTNEPLRWAYYLALISILIIMIFEAKRKQRIIPVITPLANASLEFVATIGNLYYQKGDHKNIAEKKIEFFFDQVRSHYFISNVTQHESFVQALSKKTGRELDETREVIGLINKVKELPTISAATLQELTAKLDHFLNKKITN